jgi:tetratricopeptide (TPR) repeat protein
MKRSVFLLSVFIAAALTAYSQRIDKPTLSAKPCNDSERQLVSAGTKLHDSKRYDEAIALYKKVLEENPDCTEAMYELTMSLYASGDKTQSMDVAYKGTKYKSDQLPLFYLVIGSIIDDIGKPDEAVKIYRDGIKMLEGDPKMAVHLSSMYYNLAVTLAKQNKLAEARTEVKHSIEYNFGYASPHYLLALIYQNGKYKIPAFLAAARLISLEPASQRTQRAAAIIRGVLKPAEKDPKTGNINIFINMDAPTDEGDFAMYDLILGTLTTVKSDKDKKKSENEIFADSVDSVFAMVSEDKKLPSTFVGKNYLPFVVDLKKQGLVKVFSYIVMSASGDENALKWLGEHTVDVNKFAAWGKSYR